MRNLSLVLGLSIASLCFACGDDKHDDDDEGVSGDSIAECIKACVDRGVNGGSSDSCEKQCEDVGD